MKHQDTFATIEGLTDYSQTQYHPNVHPPRFRVKVMKSLKEANVFHVVYLMAERRLDLEVNCSPNHVEKWVITLTKQLEEEVNIY